MQKTEESIKNNKLELSRDTTTLIMEIAKKIARTGLKQHAIDAIIPFLESKLPLLYNESSITISVSPDILELLEKTLATSPQFDTVLEKLNFHSDGNQTPGSCNILWSNGSMKIDTENITQEIEKIMHSFEKA